jgi:hypothetical protein
MEVSRFRDWTVPESAGVGFAQKIPLSGNCFRAKKPFNYEHVA